MAQGDIIRVGVVGVGRGRSFAAGANELVAMTLVALSDPWEHRLNEIGTKHAVATYTDYDKFLEHDMDAVVLANYFHEHAPFAIKALAAGKHVMSETMCNATLGEGVALCRAVEKSGKPTVLGAISGAVAGLVVITPASGFVTPMSAILLGVIGGIACFLGATVLKNALGYDDSLDAFGVHGLGGTLGAILTGIFASGAVNSAIAGKFEGGVGQLKNQLLATVITWVIAIVGCFILLKLVDAILGLRVSESEEGEGLDITQHGESGYNFEDLFGGSIAASGHGMPATAKVEAAPAGATAAVSL
jgi:hypothetical protein